MWISLFVRRTKKYFSINFSVHEISELKVLNLLSHFLPVSDPWDLRMIVKMILSLLLLLLSILFFHLVYLQQMKIELNLKWKVGQPLQMTTLLWHAILLLFFHQCNCSRCWKNSEILFAILTHSSMVTMWVDCARESIEPYCAQYCNQCRISKSFPLVLVLLLLLWPSDRVWSVAVIYLLLPQAQRFVCNLEQVMCVCVC